MAGSRLLQVIHVVGYATTVVVLAELAGLGYLYCTRWSRSETVHARFREATRTHDRALGDASIEEADAAKSYQPVRPPPAEPGEAIGFVFMPSFSPWYAASLRLPPGAAVAQGERVDVQHDEQTRQLTFSPVRSFTAPKTAYLAAAQRIDALADGWPGNGREDCFDGAPVAFERIKAGRVTSGVGNASCDAHYAAVRKIMEPLILRFGPKTTSGE